MLKNWASASKLHILKGILAILALTLSDFIFTKTEFLIKSGLYQSWFVQRVVERWDTIPKGL